MLTLRKAQERGHANHGWLDSYHTFSFADYYDPRHMGFRNLRVINEDRIAGGGGFPPHPHRDMEIITYMIEGELAHQDSMGNHEVIRPGEVQRMSAGTGIVHSEFNHSSTVPCHLLQIWILPDRGGHKPSYGQKNFLSALGTTPLVLAASMDEREGSVGIHQDVDLYMGRMKDRETHEFTLRPGRHAWLQLVKGELNVNDQRLSPGDALAVSDEKRLQITSQGNTEFLLFDLN